MTRALPDERIELRLALVCYGGVSLAVSMHGVTKELHKLVQASRRFDHDGDLDAPNGFAADDSAAAYYEALREIAEAGRHLSVTIDAIAGTSAGGINGVVLGKVLARGGSQEKLKKLWIDQGDLKTLLRAPVIGGVQVRAVLAGLELLGRQLLGTTGEKAKSPLKGERMSKLLVGAIRDIDTSAADDADGSLVPETGSLDLYVTATDLHGFEMLVPTGVGGASQHDRQHAQVLHFAAASRADTEAQFGTHATGALAFAARATSAFPGAFAPINAVSFGTESGTPLDLPFLKDMFVYPYEENDANAVDAWFVDGGVLDNAPFDHVVRAIAAKPARSQVVRRMVYIQPDPGLPPGPAKQDDGPPQAPSWLSGLKQAALDVKGNHDVLRDLIALRDLNLRIPGVSTITEVQMGAVQAMLHDAVAATSAGPLTKSTFQAVSDTAHQQAADRLGAGYATYLRLKLKAAVRRLTDEVAHLLKYAPEGRRDSFLRATAGAWVEGLPQWKAEDPAGLIAMLRKADVPYRQRRLFFLLAGINALYREIGAGPGAPERAQLDALKDRAWVLLEELRTIPRDVVARVDAGFLEWTPADAHVLGDPEDFAAQYVENFQEVFDAYSAALDNKLGDGGSVLWTDFQEQAHGWDEKYQRVLRDRYLAFPFWDGLIFPTVALAELPQFTPIGVAQYSPPAAGALTAEDGKLKGVALAHFAGFLKSEWRQNDYLWGRLDGVELNLRTLYDAGSAHPAPARTTHPSVQEAVQTAGGKVLQQGLTAVLDAEEDLTGITQTMGSSAGRSSDCRSVLRARCARGPSSRRGRSAPGPGRTAG